MNKTIPKVGEAFRALSIALDAFDPQPTLDWDQIRQAVQTAHAAGLQVQSLIRQVGLITIYWKTEDLHRLGREIGAVYGIS